MSQTSVGQNSGMVWLFSLPRISETEIKVSSRLSSTLEIVGQPTNKLHSDGWKKSLPCSCRTAVTFSLLLETVFNLWRLSIFLVTESSPFSKPAIENLLCIESLTIQSTLFKKSTVPFQGLLSRVRVTKVKFPILSST